MVIFGAQYGTTLVSVKSNFIGEDKEDSDFAVLLNYFCWLCYMQPQEESPNLRSISEYQMQYLNHQHKYSTNTNN